MSEFTEAERKLFHELGYGHLMGPYSIHPIMLYEYVGLLCFIDRVEGDPVEALRRGVRATHECSPYRHTEEFDKLISWEE